MSVTITLLIDNTAHLPHLAHEHGFSCAVTPADGSLWLWDTGASAAFLKNADALGIPAHEAQGLILSHGHWDHAGGLAPLLERGFTGAVYAHPAYQRERYSCHPGEGPRYIGVSKLPSHLPRPDVRGVADGFRIGDDITVVTDIHREPGQYEATKDFYLDTDCTQPDSVPDDACLLIPTAKGMVLLLGCCHSGMANTLGHIRERFGLDQIYAVIGGTHLMDAPDSAIRESVEALKAARVQHIYPAHCTGKRGFEALEKLLPGKVHPTGGGHSLTF